MANYTRPGVYVEEALNPLSDVVSAPGQAVGAFVGASGGGGPVGPILISSWSQYQTLFGGITTALDDLAYAVYSYFSNGGAPCFVVRAVNADAIAGALTILDTAGTPVSTLTVTATAPGTWSTVATSNTRVFVTVQPSSPVGRFDLIIEVGSGGTLAAREQFVDLTMDPLDGRNAIEIVNSSVVGSKYVTLASVFSGTYVTTKNPGAITKVPLTGGSEGTGSPNLFTAVQTLGLLDQNLVVNVPGADSTVVTSTANWAAASGRHFVVADVVKPAAAETAAGSVTAITTFAAAVPKTSHLAVYGPWLYFNDPGVRANGALRLTAPGGSVVGQYLRTDALRGVHQAPAGLRTSLSGAVAAYVVYTDAQQDSLAALNVNLIKKVPGSGITIWGARTQAAGYPDRYVPVRRTLIDVKSNLTALTRFAVFENNSADLWALVSDVCSTYLGGLLELGALKGNTDQEGFYVLCSSVNNTPATISAGVVNIEVGVALQQPAEFIVIRLGQTTGAATASDSLEE